MEFKKERVYTAINADELKPGDKVIVANDLKNLKRKVFEGFNYYIMTITSILGEEYLNRVSIDNDRFPFAYLVERKENCTNCGEGKWDAEHKKILCDPVNCGNGNVVFRNHEIEVCEYWKPITEQKAEHDCQSCKYINCGFKDFNTKNDCDRWEADVKAEMPELISLGNGQYVEKPKTEKKYRPFETIGELINEWVIKGGKWQHREKTMPLIWVRGKNCSVNRLITSFDETEKGDRVMICGLDCSMEDLFNIYTFLDGSPCGVEE